MKELEDTVRVGKALSDRTRVRILTALAVKDLCVCELTSLVGVGQPAVSRHLGVLRAAGLVEDVRDGQWVNYRLRPGPRGSVSGAVLRWLSRTGAADADLLAFRRRAKGVDRRRL